MTRNKIREKLIFTETWRRPLKMSPSCAYHSTKRKCDTPESIQTGFPSKQEKLSDIQSYEKKARFKPGGQDSEDDNIFIMIIVIIIMATPPHCGVINRSRHWACHCFVFWEEVGIVFNTKICTTQALRSNCFVPPLGDEEKKHTQKTAVWSAAPGTLLQRNMGKHLKKIGLLKFLESMLWKKIRYKKQYGSMLLPSHLLVHCREAEARILL